MREFASLVSSNTSADGSQAEIVIGILDDLSSPMASMSIAYADGIDCKVCTIACVGSRS